MTAQCDKIQSMIDAFIDGELTKQDQIFVREHLKRCTECRLLVEELVDVGDRLASLPRVKCSEPIEKKIQSYVIDTEDRTEKPRPIRSFLESLHGRTVAVGLAVAVILVFLIIGPFFRGDESIPRTFTPEEIVKAREEAELGLSYLGSKINHTERSILEQVLLKDLPKTVRNSIRKTVPLFRGGQG